MPGTSPAAAGRGSEIAASDAGDVDVGPQEAKRLEMLLSQAQDKLRSAEESLQVSTTARTSSCDGVEVASSAHGDFDMEEEKSSWLMLIPEDARSERRA